VKLSLKNNKKAQVIGPCSVAIKKSLNEIYGSMIGPKKERKEEEGKTIQRNESVRTQVTLFFIFLLINLDNRLV
jgi:hypothetical protein